MIEYLAVFGDSTTQGSELVNGNECYGELLQKKFGINSFVNFGQPAAGPQHLVVQLRKFVNDSTTAKLRHCLAVFWIGGYDRTIVHHDNEWIFITPKGGFSTTTKNKEYANLVNEQYFKYFHSQELLEFNLNTSLITLQAMCRQYGIQDFYLPGWQLLNLWPEVDLSKVYENGKRSFYDLFGLEDKIQHIEKNRDNIYIKPNLTHPNQLGHQLIADTAYKFISNYIDNTV